MWIFYYTGLVYSAYLIWGVVYSIGLTIYRKYVPLNFTQTYGAGSYALITGATSGIGKQIALALGKKGINIIAVGRDVKRLEDVRQELLKANPKLKVVSITKDFKDSMSEGFHKDLADKTKDYDVSIIINNVGMGYSDSNKSDLYIEKKEVNQILEMIYVNILSYTMNHLYFYNRFKQRKACSMFFDISSVASVNYFTLSNIYGATKGFNHYITNSLAFSNNDPKIHYLSYTPGSINTTLLTKLGHELKNSMPFVLSVETAVDSILNFCGLTQCSPGHWIHCMVTLIAQFLTLFDRTWVMSAFHHFWRKDYRG